MTTIKLDITGQLHETTAICLRNVPGSSLRPHFNFKCWPIQGGLHVSIPFNHGITFVRGDQHLVAASTRKHPSRLSSRAPA